MKTLGYITLFSLMIFACQKPESDLPKIEDESLKKIEALQLKLDATEAQLYNARVEISKCKGDSIPSDVSD